MNLKICMLKKKDVQFSDLQFVLKLFLTSIFLIYFLSSPWSSVIKTTHSESIEVKKKFFTYKTEAAEMIPSLCSFTHWSDFAIIS